MNIFLVQRPRRLVFNGHMDSPIIMRDWVSARSRGFHKFIFKHVSCKCLAFFILNHFFEVSILQNPVWFFQWVSAGLKAKAPFNKKCEIKKLQQKCKPHKYVEIGPRLQTHQHRHSY
jgi:hypothetical protein